MDDEDVDSGRLAMSSLLSIVCSAYKCLFINIRNNLKKHARDSQTWQIQWCALKGTVLNP